MTENNQTPEFPPEILAKADPELDSVGVTCFKYLYKRFISFGYPSDRAINLANIRALEKRARHQC